jgi:hypothetical protein
MNSQIDFNIMRNKINDFEYLEERSWFMTNEELQKKLMKVINIGLGYLVCVVEGDFEIHLDSLIILYYESKDNGDTDLFYIDEEDKTMEYEEKYN